MPAFRPNFPHLVTGPRGQALNGDGLVMVEKNGVPALQSASLILPPEIIASGQRHTLVIGQFHDEAEVFQIICLIHFPQHLLADGQLPGIRGRGSLFIGDHHHIQQAEQVGQVHSVQAVFVGVCLDCVCILGVSTGQSRVILLHPDPDIARIADKEGLVHLSAVHIVKAVIHLIVYAEMEVHGPQDLSYGGAQLHILPIHRLDIRIFRRLILAKGPDIPKGNVHIPVRGKFPHGLGEFSHTGHDHHTVILISGVGIDGIGPHHHGYHGGVLIIAGGSADFFQIVVGPLGSIRPDDLGVAVAFIISGREDQKPIPAIHRPGGTPCHFLSAALICIKSKDSPVQRHAILGHLLDPKLPLFVGNIDEGAEIPVKLVHIEETESLPAAGAGYRYSHDFFQCSLCPIGLYILAQGCIFFLRRQVRFDAKVSQSRRLDHTVDHPHISVFLVVELIPAGKARQVGQHTDQPTVLAVPVQMPGRGIFHGGLHQRSLQGRRPPLCGKSKAGVLVLGRYGMEPCQIAAVEGDPGPIFPLGFLQQHRHRHHKALPLRLLRYPLVFICRNVLL